jgi:hypothetical protein
MKVKLLLPLALLLVLGIAYQFVLSRPAPPPRPKIEGDVYVLPREFTLNLAEGRYARVTVALVLPHGVVDGAGGEESGATEVEPPEGFGTLPQEALAVVTQTLAGAPARQLLRPSPRRALSRRVLRQLRATTDVPATRVVLTDVAVQ